MPQTKQNQVRVERRFWIKAKAMTSNNERSTRSNGTTAAGAIPDSRGSRPAMHPAWVEFVRFCEKLQHGEIERLRIQGGLPVLAELTTKKVKFG
ncbi:MAG TPA: hypothetical protein VG204_07065 [Terriglobia bacterium]|nr:hypothetical protein [Terriglobia bacterium]